MHDTSLYLKPSSIAGTARSNYIGSIVQNHQAILASTFGYGITLFIEDAAHENAQRHRQLLVTVG
jgi:hypothetical protein